MGWVTQNKVLKDVATMITQAGSGAQARDLAVVAPISLPSRSLPPDGQAWDGPLVACPTCVGPNRSAVTFLDAMWVGTIRHRSWPHAALHLHNLEMHGLGKGGQGVHMIVESQGDGMGLAGTSRP